jgi:hypothetical protein
MSSRFLKLWVALLVLALLVFSAGCGNSSNTAQLRIMHASPDETNLDVLIDGKIMASDLAYQGDTSYFTLSTGSHQVQLNLTGTSTSVLTASVNLASSTETTLIAYNYAANLTSLVLTDNNTAPASGDIQLRFVQAAPGVGTADVYVVTAGTGIGGTTPSITGLAFGKASAYQTLSATSTTTGTGYEIFFTTTGTNLAFIDTGSLTFSSGQIRTVVALLNPAGGYTFSLLADLN